MLSHWVIGGVEMEGRGVVSLIIGKVELSLVLDGNERDGEAAAVSLTVLPPLLHYQKKKGNLRIGIHYLFLQRD